MRWVFASSSVRVAHMGFCARWMSKHGAINAVLDGAVAIPLSSDCNLTDRDGFRDIGQKCTSMDFRFRRMGISGKHFVIGERMYCVRMWRRVAVWHGVFLFCGKVVIEKQ